MSSSPYNSPVQKHYKYSYSGSDAVVFAWFDKLPQNAQPLESLHTLSISVHESKGQVRALGFRGIKGMARGIRTVAGSLIMTVIRDHPLRNLIFNSPRTSLGWSYDRYLNGIGSLNDNYDFGNKLAVVIPPFNIAAHYVAEHSMEAWDPTNKRQRVEAAGWMLRGVEFIDEGQITSINDIVTEMTFSFIAQDYKPWSAFGIGESREVTAALKQAAGVTKYSTVGNVIATDFDVESQQ
jgi:hypothetical protein